MLQGVGGKGLDFTHLLVAHIDPVAAGSESHDVCRQLAVLALSQQLLPASFIHPERGAYPCQQLALEPCQGSRNAASSCTVHQLQLSSTVLEAVQSDVALCRTDICKAMQHMGEAVLILYSRLLAGIVQEELKVVSNNYAVLQLTERAWSKHKELHTIHLPWVEGQALHSANRQEELILWHAAELYQAEADGSLIIVQLKNTAQRKEDIRGPTERAVRACDA